MNIEKATSLLGRPSGDPEVQALLHALTILRQPEMVVDEDDGSVLNAQDWLLNKKMGVELGFDARAHFVGEEVEDPDAEPMLFTQIYLYCDHDDVGPYRGTLPGDLVASDSRIAVRDKLSGRESTRRSYIRDTWELPDYQLIVSYANGGNNIGFVVCQLRPPPMPADASDAARIPSIEQILHALGSPLSASELQSAFAHLRLDQNLDGDNARLVGNFDTHLGLQLFFGHLAGGKDLVLTHVIFYREHEAEGARWPGYLPNGLNFDDSPERMFAKIAQEPTKHHDGDYSGDAIWSFSEYTLRVIYSTMENYILQVQIAAPGAPPIA